MKILDTRAIKSRIDCRDLIARDLGRGKERQKYTMYLCPFHPDITPSLAVYANGYHCFGCHQSGDAFQWLMTYHRLSFRDAYDRLEACHLPIPKQPICQTVFRSDEPPSSHWQNAIWNLVDDASKTLWSVAGRPARTYLQQRGLKLKTIRAAALGYLPGDRPRLIDGYKIYPGIFIPWITADALWTVKIRRFQGTPKYLQIAGGSTHGLYGADLIRPDQPVFMVEGEFDALIGQQILGHAIPVVTTGSASYPLRPRWVQLIDKAPKVVFCMDQDAAGAKSAARLLQALPHAKIVHTPLGNDLTDLYLQVGERLTRQWLQQTVRLV